jgi:hypothetical protein
MNKKMTWKRTWSSFFTAALFSSATAFAQTSNDIVGMSIACSSDRVFTWYRDGHVTIGNSEHLDAHQGHEPSSRYSLPPGKTTDDIVAIGISKKDHVYTWYADNTKSIGTSSDLDSREAPSSYSVAPGKSPADIVGIDIACSTDRVFTWYGDHTKSIGSSSDLDLHQAPTGYFLAAGKSPADLVELGIAGTKDHVYAWYRDRTASAGKSSDLDSFRELFGYAVVTPPCDLFASLPELNGSDVIAIGSRGPSCESNAGITVLLKEDRRFWFDKVLTQAIGGSNADVIARFHCSGNRGAIVYTQVKSRGREKQSRRVGISLCF